MTNKYLSPGIFFISALKLLTKFKSHTVDLHFFISTHLLLAACIVIYDVLSIHWEQVKLPYIATDYRSIYSSHFLGLAVALQDFTQRSFPTLWASSWLCPNSMFRSFPFHSHSHSYCCGSYNDRTVWHTVMDVFFQEFSPLGMRVLNHLGSLGLYYISTTPFFYS